MTSETAKLVNELKRLFSNLDTIPMSSAEKLLRILNEAPREALEIIVKERIKFCWMPAMARLVDDHGLTREQVASL